MAFGLSMLAAVLILGCSLQESVGQQSLNNDINDINDDDYYTEEWPEFSPIDSLAYWDDGEEPALGSDATPCCMPKTWQGTLFAKIQSGGGRGKRGRVIVFKEDVYVDENNKRVAQDVTVPRRGKNGSTISYIIKFNTSSNVSEATLYAFSKVARKCVTKRLKNAKFRPMCLPANATRRGSFSLGAGARALQVEAWSYRIRDRRMAACGNVILTPGNCIPVLADERVVVRPRFTDVNEDDDDFNKPKPKPRPKGFHFGALYNNIKTQITDPSVFNPPSYCKSTSDTLFFDPDIDFTSIIQRFVTVP